MEALYLFLLMTFFHQISLTRADDYPNYGMCKSCYDGYTGAQCTQPLCFGETTCENGGNCTSPNNCTCLAGYTGNKCGQAVCFGSLTCENGGTCISPDKCSCTSDFTGERCETEHKTGIGCRNAMNLGTVFVVLMLLLCLHPV